MPSLTPYDEHFVHQIPEPLSVVGIEHEYWRESYFVVAHGPDVDTDVIVIAMATYPARHTLDALVLGRVGGELLGVFHQRPADGDPHTSVVGPVSVVIEEPFRRVHVVVDGADGFDADFTFEARTAPYALRRGRLLDDAGALLWDQSHMIQSGTFTGYVQQGRDAPRSLDGWLGQRDHSWGVRDHGRIPCWTWFAIQLPDGMLGVWHWELANGARIFTDGCWAPADGARRCRWSTSPTICTGPTPPASSVDYGADGVAGGRAVGHGGLQPGGRPAGDGGGCRPLVRALQTVLRRWSAPHGGGDRRRSAGHRHLRGHRPPPPSLLSAAVGAAYLTGPPLTGAHPTVLRPGRRCPRSRPAGRRGARRDRARRPDRCSPRCGAGRRS